MADLQMNVSDKAIGSLIMRYNETSWEFAQRMASTFGAPISANVNTEKLRPKERSASAVEALSPCLLKCIKDF